MTDPANLAADEDALIAALAERASDPVRCHDRAGEERRAITEQEFAAIIGGADKTRVGRVLPRRPGNPPANPEDLAASERERGVDLPPLLRRVYTEVGDGGFGPGFGLLTSKSALTMAATKGGFGGRVPLAEFGSAIYATLDHRTGDVWMFHPNCPPETATDDSWPIQRSLAGWLADWVSGTDVFALDYTRR